MEINQTPEQKAGIKKANQERKARCEKILAEYELKKKEKLTPKKSNKK